MSSRCIPSTQNQGNIRDGVQQEKRECGTMEPLMTTATCDVQVQFRDTPNKNHGPPNCKAPAWQAGYARHVILFTKTVTVVSKSVHCWLLLGTEDEL